MSSYRAPRDCPVCSSRLETTQLGCPHCGTGLVGHFAPCDFCGLDDADLTMLKVFLASRGNMRDLERHLGVSYPTARARFDDLLRRLGLAAGAPGPSARRGPLRTPPGKWPTPPRKPPGWRRCGRSPRATSTSRKRAAASREGRSLLRCALWANSSEEQPSHLLDPGPGSLVEHDGLGHDEPGAVEGEGRGRRAAGTPRRGPG